MSPRRPVARIHVPVPYPYRDGDAGHLHRHQVNESEVADICLGGTVESSGWHDDPDRGTRLFVVGRTFGGRRLWVWLKPIPGMDPEDFWIMTAYDWRR